MSTANLDSRRNVAGPLRASREIAETWHDFNLDEIVSSADLSDLHQAMEGFITTCRTRQIERDRYRVLFELESDAQLILDGEGIILEANCAVSALLDVPTQALSAQALTSWIAAADRNSFLDHMALAKIQQQGKDWEGRLQMPSKPPFQVSLALTALPRQPGQPEAFGCAVRDLSKREVAGYA